MGTPPKGCPCRTVLRDWKQSLADTFGAFSTKFRLFGETDILGGSLAKIGVSRSDTRNSSHAETQKPAGIWGRSTEYTSNPVPSVSLQLVRQEGQP